VAIIGAGAAGLVAAHQVARAGWRVLILEARGRSGGRILTDRAADPVHVVELGAEFVHGRPQAMLDLLRHAGIAVHPLDGEHWVLANGRLIPMRDGDTSGMHQLMARAGSERVDRSVLSFVEEASRDPSLRESAGWMLGMTQGFDAADPARASLRAIIDEWSGDEGTESGQGRPIGGYGAMVDFMTRRLDPSKVHLRMNAAVRTVRWSRGHVELEIAAEDGRPERIDAHAAVITVPLSILQLDAGHPAAIHFEPALDAKRTALSGLAHGPVHRVMLRYPEGTWQRVLGDPVPAGTFMHARGLPFPTFWTGEEGSPWLTAWCGGPAAARLDHEADSAIVAHAVDSARALFQAGPQPAPEPLETRFHNWQRDPWSQGAYSYVTVGGGTARRSLAEPLSHALYFAGEATEATGEAGTVASAVTSGARAAAEFLRDHPLA
jgi:monoamine oxidase